MSKLKTSKQRLLPLALVPLFSVAVLAGCGSDDDDPVTTNPGGMTGGNTLVGDDDGNGIPDAFETLDATADANGNGIADVYEMPIDADATPAADTNDNGIDDSFESAVQGGDDANSDGVVDAQAAALAGGGDTGGGDTGGGDTGGGDTGGGDTGGGDTGGNTGGGDTTPPATGALNDISIGFGDNNVGNAALVWDGTTLSGQVDMVDGTSPVGAAIYTGIAAGGNGQQAVALNGDGNPTYFVPSGLAADQAALITDNISSGNLYIQIDLADGSSQNGIILVDGVQPKFTSLSAGNSVPAGTAFSNGQGFMNLNTQTGDFVAVVNVALDATDVDADGNPQTITAAHIHSGGTGENGPVLVGLDDTGSGTSWTAKGTFSTDDLSSVLQGRAYFNVHGTDGSGFIRGQIPASQ